MTSVTGVGVTLTAIATDAAIVTVADAESVARAWLVAVTSTVFGVGGVAGAV